MKYAYADIREQEFDSGWKHVADVSNNESYIINGEIPRGFSILRQALVRYDYGDQFCEIVTAQEVETDLQELAAELAEALTELRKLRPESVVEDANRERCEDCEQLMYDCECGSGG
jgi:hypothetical protein